MISIDMRQLEQNRIATMRKFKSFRPIHNKMRDEMAVVCKHRNLKSFITSHLRDFRNINDDILIGTHNHIVVNLRKMGTKHMRRAQTFKNKGGDISSKRIQLTINTFSVHPNGIQARAISRDEGERSRIATIQSYRRRKHMPPLVGNHIHIKLQHFKSDMDIQILRYIIDYQQ